MNTILSILAVPIVTAIGGLVVLGWYLYKNYFAAAHVAVDESAADVAEVAREFSDRLAEDFVAVKAHISNELTALHVRLDELEAQLKANAKKVTKK